MQIMLKEVNADCQISKTNANLKENHPCLLRHGIEVNNKQSFISCISDALFFSKQLRDENNKLTNKYAKVLNVKEMRDKIIRSLTMSAFTGSNPLKGSSKIRNLGWEPKISPTQGIELMIKQYEH
jgi:nucleoside-diphosphate-sugar epimerase